MPRIKLLLLSFFLLPVLLFLLADWLFPLPVERLQPQGSMVVYDRHGEMLRVFLASDQMWRIRVKSEEISETIKQAVLTYEDQYFLWHCGINPVSILRAAIANLRAGKIVQGGSTITMQIARLMEPKARTLPGKLIEAFRALQLEWHYSKEEILTLYLDMTPYGGNIVGIGAASLLYFQKRPDQLSLGEAALLAAIPKSPNRFRPDLNPQAASQARRKVLTTMVSQGKITQAEYNEALGESIPQQRHPLPFMIPHLSDKLMQLYPDQERMQTTIDASRQRTVTAILRNHKGALRNQGITNCAAVVIDNKTGDLLALVGSIDFFDSAACGQVNGAIAPRSPGSTLKPFVYALGLNAGLISPQSLLCDVPVEYSGYEPVNYDECYSGAVTVEEALIRSLNVPAVNLYAQLGRHGLYHFLKEAEISTLPQAKEYYGLSLVLGGGEVTLLELTNLYCGLANGGLFRPCRLVTSERANPGKRLLSEEACYILTEMLCQLRRPELPAVWEWSINTPKVAWKTGTSYGHRDAWSIGYTPSYSIGVWAGNFNGKGAPALVGAEIAAPVLFDIFSALDIPGEERWFVQPAGVATRQVCAVSGMFPTEHCPNREEELYIPGISPQQRCNIHCQVLVDKKTGYRLCSHCRHGRECEVRVYEKWPAAIAAWKARNGYPIEKIPPHLPTCTQIATGTAPVIHSPVAGARYKLRADIDPAFQQILLDAQVSNSTAEIFWFLDKELVYSGKPIRRIFIIPTPGWHNLICVDDEGRSSEINITVRQESVIDSWQ